MLVAVGCGSKNQGVKNEVDAAEEKAICEVPEGHAYVFTLVEVLPPDAGRDIDGDGTIDNEFGSMPDSVLKTTNDAFAELIATGELADVSIITGWSGPPVATESGLGAIVLSAEDSDQPPDPSDNASGEEEFYLTLNEFDLNCNPTTAAREVDYRDRELTFRYDILEFPHQSATFGTMALHDVEGSFEFSEDFQVLDGAWTGVVSLCTLSLFPFPGEVSGTVLDFFISGGILGPLISVDIDIDGDGFEAVRGDGVSLKECVDGDGTVISGPDCACHPAIADGLSVVLRMQSVPARVIGFR